MGSPGIWTKIRIRNYFRGCWSLERLIRISAWVEHTNHHGGDGPKQPFNQRMDINWWPVILEKKLYHTGHVVTTPGWALPTMAPSLVQVHSWAKRMSCDASEQSVHDCGSSSLCTTALCILNRTVKDSSVTPELWHYKMVILGYFTVLSSIIVLPQVQLSTSPQWTSKTLKSTMSEFRTLTAPNNRTTSTTSSVAKKRARARRRS